MKVIMDDRSEKANKIAHQMIKREKSYLNDIPTREQARLIIEKRKALEKQQQETTSRVVTTSIHTDTNTSSPTTKKSATKRKASTTNKKAPTTTTKKASSIKKETPSKKPSANKKKSTPSHTKSVRKSHLGAKKKKSKKKKSFFTKKHIIMLISIILFTTITSIVGISLLKVRQQNMVYENSQFVTLTIVDGMNASQIASLLEQHNIIDDQRRFVDYIKDKGSEKKLLAGIYNFTHHSDYEDVHTILTEKSLSLTSTITIYKGSVVKEIDNQLSRLQLIQSGEFLASLEKERAKRNLAFTEGWVLSGQYEVERGDDVASSLAPVVIDRLYEVLKVEMETVGELSYSLNDTIIIASMIQRETQDIGQMPLIAGVIYNRLERNEPLGIDATTRYALNAWDRELVKKDFASSGEYDTRRRVGLPPTGIGSVGIDAIKAAIHPKKHNYFYYFHDKEGELHLSFTYQEHVEKYNAL